MNAGMTPEQLAIAAIRGLAMDAPHAARSGHQGTAMALAPLAHVLWQRIMTYDPADPDWPDRDRFVLSAGHASILLYSMLHLTGYAVSLDDIRNFRQWGSATPGHPEAGHLPGVEVTTGPLGQGFANGVGMGIAERWLRHRFGSDLCDHHIFVICSDGDLAEGVSHEAASLAGHLGLGRLIYIYDDNRVSIDGTTDEWLSDDPVKRFDSYGWHTQQLGEAGEDLDALETALREAMATEDSPSLLVLRSHIAHPSPELTDHPSTHGYALFDEEIASAKAAIGIPEDETFWVPSEAQETYKLAAARGREARLGWEKRLEALDSKTRSEYEAALEGRVQGVTSTEGSETPENGQISEANEAARTAKTSQTNSTINWPPSFTPGEQIATRVASNKCLKTLAALNPHIVAGGADLTGNTGTKLADAKLLSRDCADGQQIYFGVREHAMAATMVGMARHGGIFPVGGTFLVFSDYMRPSVRLATMCGAKAVFAWSHDSVAVGEDGPTHQPIEHLTSLRAIPRLSVIRPADATETVGAWQAAAARNGPTALILTRQGVPVLDQTSAEGVAKGAYVLETHAPASSKSSASETSVSSALPADAPSPANAPDIALIGTGSEVALCLEAAQMLARDNISAQVVSMPSWDLFAAQPESYRASVLSQAVPALSVEAGSTHGWHRWADDAMGIDDFGASAPGDEVMRNLGMTASIVRSRALALLKAANTSKISPDSAPRTESCC